MSEDLLGLFIFIIIGIAGLFQKLRKQGPEMQEPWQDIPQDLPEKAKDILFGKRAVQEANPAESPSREFEEPLNREQRRPPVRHQPVPAQQPPVRPAPVRTLERPQAVPRMAEPARVEKETGPRMRPGDVKIPTGQLTKRADAFRKKLTTTRWFIPPSTTFVSKKPKPKLPVKKEMKPAAPVSRRLRDLSDVRRGIILSEILGPPVSMRRD